MRLGTLMLAFGIALLASSWAGAQVLYGNLTGTVTDATGAVVNNAQITALEVNTGVAQTQNTDSSGIYRFPALLPGTYKVTITAQGFSNQETEGVTIRANELARVDAKLTVASATQSVTVTTAAPILQTDTADVHTDVTAHQLANLPIMGTQGANFQGLLRTIPGAGLTAETNSQAGNPQRAINVNMNGTSYQSANTRIDGVQDLYPWLPANVAYVPPAQAIESVNVATNSFNAEQGNAGGFALNVLTKSGTNHFHGNAHEYHTDQNFAARNYFTTDVTFPGQAKKNRNNQNQFGGAVGGPIKKDMVFFFADYERTTQRLLAGPDTRTLPTPAMLAGDFTKAGYPIIYDPATGDVHGNNKTQVACNGVKNMICPSRFDPAAAAMISLLQQTLKTTPEVATSNDLNNWAGNGTAEFNRNNMDAKVTYVASDKTNVWGRYSFSQTLVYDPPLLGPAIGDATNGGQLGNAPGLVQVVGLGVSHTFSPTLLVDWNFGFTRQRLGSTFDLVSPNGLNDFKIPGTNNVGAPGDPTLYYGLPGFIFPTAQVPAGTTIPNNQANLGNAQPANPFLFRDQQWVTGANLSWNRGKHSLRGGIEWNHAQINHFQPQGGTFQQPRGSFEFNGYITALRGTTPTWYNSWADFLLGLPSGTGKARALFNPNALRWSVWAWYLQDRFQVTPKLTLTVGLRWEYYPFGYSDNGKGLRVLNLNTGNVILGGYGGVPQNDGIDTGIGQFLPRVGAAYRITNSTVLRVGYGLSADPYTWHVLRNAYPAVILDTNTAANTSDYIAAASLTGMNGTGLGSGSYSVPSGIVLAPLPNLSSGSVPLPTNAGTTTIPNPFNRGYINSYNLSIQQEVVKNFTANIGYVGTYQIRPVINMNANASLPGTGTAGGLLYQKWAGGAGPVYTGTINMLNPYLHNRYDSLQTQLIYRFAGGSNVTAAYTWAKSMNYADNEDLGGLAYPYPSPQIIQLNYAPSTFDRTHNLEIAGVIAMPFGKDGRWLKEGPGSWILGGWLVNPIISGMSGFPFTVSASSSLNANGSGETADLVAPFRKLGGKPPRNGVTCAVGDPRCSYFDPASFGAPVINPNVPSTAHYGNTKRNQFRGPGFFNMNMSIVRDFKIREFATLQVRGDAFGFTNTPHFNNPNVSCPATGNPASGIEQACNTGTPNNFGVVTSVVQPGGFFGPDAGNRIIWLGATVNF